MTLDLGLLGLRVSLLSAVVVQFRVLPTWHHESQLRKGFD